MLAQMVHDHLAGPLHFGLQQIGQQWHAAAATRACLAALLERVERVDPFVVNGRADRLFRHIVAGANLGRVRHGVEPQAALVFGDAIISSCGGQGSGASFFASMASRP